MFESLCNLPESFPSLCIPRVFNNITEGKIRHVFNVICFGKISYIDIREYKNEKGEGFKRVFVHFEKWASDENTQAVRNKLVTGNDIKIVYDNPWFWKISASKCDPSKKKENKTTTTKQLTKPLLKVKAEVPIEGETDEFGRDLKLRYDFENPRMYSLKTKAKKEWREDNVDVLTDLYPMNVNYGPFVAPPIRKRKVLVKESEKDFSEEDKQEYQLLYGDL